MDDRDWNEDFTESRKNYEKIRTMDDKKIIERYAYKTTKTGKNKTEKWIINFVTIYGISESVYFPYSGKWHNKNGKAKGKGAESMLKYFRPIAKD